jgi:hypothetical protein
MSRSEPFKGGCNLSPFSSLRKRMRAARRGFAPVFVPDERALMRHAWYRRKKEWDALRLLLGD